MPEECACKGEYKCYVLRSEPCPWKTYSGSTNDFVHRLRQHNGALVGGARMTKTSRPWKTAIIVYGFTNRSSALRYEWFTKMKHSKTWIVKFKEGKNALQRRASLLLTAELKMKPDERKKLQYFIPDELMSRYMKEARLQGVPGTLEASYRKYDVNPL